LDAGEFWVGELKICLLWWATCAWGRCRDATKARASIPVVVEEGALEDGATDDGGRLGVKLCLGLECGLRCAAVAALNAASVGSDEREFLPNVDGRDGMTDVCTAG